jgi:hypothetical protein
MAARAARLQLQEAGARRRVDGQPLLAGELAHRRQDAADRALDLLELLEPVAEIADGSAGSDSASSPRLAISGAKCCSFSSADFIDSVRVPTPAPRITGRDLVTSVCLISRTRLPPCICGRHP